MTVMKKLLMGWFFEFALDAALDYADRLAQRSDTDLDNQFVAKFRENRELFLKCAKGKM